MGWYGEQNVWCPNCGKDNAVVQFHNDLRGPLFLGCPDCGLIMGCKRTEYIIENSYINKDIIGKNPDDITFEGYDFDFSKNENIIKDKTYEFM